MDTCDTRCHTVTHAGRTDGRPVSHPRAFLAFDSRPSVSDRRSDISFPPLPSTVSSVSQLIASRDTDIESLTRLVKRDLSVSVHVLRRVNSAYFGLRREITSVEQAVRLLGFTNVASLAMIGGLQTMENAFSSNPQLFERIVEDAVFAARFAQVFVGGLDLSKEWQQIAFIAGLLPSASRLVLLHTWPERYATLARDARPALPDADAERRACGNSHLSLAPNVCTPWGVPERICSVLSATPEAPNPHDCPRRAVTVAVCTGAEAAASHTSGASFALPAPAQTIREADVDDLARRAAEEAAAFLE